MANKVVFNQPYVASNPNVLSIKADGTLANSAALTKDARGVFTAVDANGAAAYNEAYGINPTTGTPEHFAIRLGSSYQQTVLNDGPELYARMNDLVGADLSGNGYALTLSGGMTNTPGPLVDGSNAITTTAANYNFTWGDVINVGALADMSFEMWYNPFATAASSYGILSKGNSGSFQGWACFQNSTQHIQFTRYGSGVSSAATSTATVTAATWYHIAVAYNGATNTSRMYINGVLDKTTVHSGLPTGIDASNAPLKIGSLNAAISSTPNPQSSFQEIAIYKDTLDSGQVYSHYAVGLSGA